MLPSGNDAAFALAVFVFFKEIKFDLFLKIFILCFVIIRNIMEEYFILRTMRHANNNLKLTLIRLRTVRLEMQSNHSFRR